jgi:hypothetical protein
MPLDQSLPGSTEETLTPTDPHCHEDANECHQEYDAEPLHDTSQTSNQESHHSVPDFTMRKGVKRGRPQSKTARRGLSGTVSNDATRSHFQEQQAVSRRQALIREEDNAQGLEVIYESPVTKVKFFGGDVIALEDGEMIFQEFMNQVSMYLRVLSAGTDWTGFLITNDISTPELQMGGKRGKSNFATILFSSHHYIFVTFTPSCKKCQINIYDSSFNSKSGEYHLNVGFQKKLMKLFGQKSEPLKCTVVQTQQQIDGTSCGYFSILFALGLLHKFMPDTLVLPQTSVVLGKLVHAFTRDGIVPRFHSRHVKRQTIQFIIPEAIYEDVLRNNVL